ncbi:uncharacterized protein LOC142231207 [Haematobia irritans]|uniref:uncharacterized protein LOC142231207 n=1 Tax=Haematobia irritans TaxID=7368 RepID=UPI003F4FAC58
MMSSQSLSPNVEREHRVKMLQRNRLVKLLSNLNTQTFDDLSQAEIEVKLEFLESKINLFEQLQSDLEYMDETQFNETHRDDMESSYCSVKAKLVNVLSSRKSFAAPLHSTMITQHDHSSRVSVNLPKLQLSKFGGQYKQWLDFYNMFSVLVDQNESLSNVEKFQYLRSCLEDDAAQLVHSLEVTDSNYQMALELLSSRYGNKRYIFNAHLQDIFNIEKLVNPNSSQLRNFVDTINANLRAIQSFASKSQISDGILLNLVVSKFDIQTKTQWEEEISNNSHNHSSEPFYLPDWDSLTKFLEKKSQTMDIIANDRLTKSNSHHRKPVSFVVSESICHLCDQGGKHNPFRCTVFMSLDPLGRYDLIKKKGLCLNCLTPNHVSSNCPSTNRCQQCNVSHHTLLHREKTKSKVDDESSTPVVLQVTKGNEIIIATALVEIVSSSGKKITARAMLDSASQLHFVTERVAQILGLQRDKINMDISGIGTNSIKAYNQCRFNLKSIHYAFNCFVEAVILPSITGNQPHTAFNINGWNIPLNIKKKLADPNFNIPSQIDVLLGTGVFYELLMIGQIKIQENLPTLQKTSLGWIVAGGITKSPIASSTTQYSVLATTTTHLEKILEKFWIVEENINSTPAELSVEEQDCENYFSQTTTRCPKTGRFIVRLSFKSMFDKLGDSYDIAYRRLLLLEKRMQSDSELKVEYTNFINEYIELGHMKLVQKQSSFNYIPHHYVTKLDSSTTKLRVVFDGSSKTTSGVSLNDLLRVGPKLQDDLFTILLRFRSHKIVLMADITKMYRQVMIHPDDRKWQCILWRNSQSEPVNIYQLQTVTYGTTCASYLATKCLQQLAQDQQLKFPLGSKIVLNDFYVDNLMTGADTIDEVIEIKNQVTKLLETGGFPLRKFASNVSNVIKDINMADREPTFQLYDMEFIKALGLKWSPSADSFLFYYQLPVTSSKLTKRKILSHIATFFDPLGLINPIIVQCKILMQGLWKLKIHWDESVPHSIATQWENICRSLPDIKNLKIKRLVHIKSKIEIHGFADASTKAYGACIYVVCKEGVFESSLLCAKSRVAPTRPVTLPRLELCAALLLAELLDSVCKIFNPNPANVHCWSDSSIALAWINGDPNRWNQFVANRVRKIQSATFQYTWHHCPTTENPADLVSRGANVKDLIDNQLWFYGPQFLQKEVNEWPQLEPSSQPIIPEERHEATALLVASSPSLFKGLKYANSFKRVVRVFAYANRFINLCKRRNDVPVGDITIEEENSALMCICISIQRECYSEEYEKLSRKENLRAGSKLSQLSPFMDNNIIRVGGRLINSSLPYATVHPILLPNDHPFVDVLIAYYHKLHMHAGIQTLTSLLRDQFWIVNSRDTIRRVIHQCIICYRCRPRIAEQIMGSLPKDRVEPTYPFAITGVDYCGPFHITPRLRGKNLIKVYVAVFICFSTKAIHMELATDLSSTAFLSALKRFVARRGKCHTIYSDNATNFVGANRELKEMLQHFLSTEHITNVEEMCRQEGIQWKFIPPRSPHFGGLWESAVKQAKYFLQRSLGNCLFTYDELQTVCCQAEAIVNSRPLTPLSSDPDDLRALTPSHFLIGRTSHTICEPSVVNEKVDSLKRYQQMQWVQQSFWKRWHAEYIRELQSKTKWKLQHTNLSINDLVLIKEDNLPPLKWKLGRIVETIQGPDGHVRVVIVKTAEGQQKRAITRICKLPINSN